MSEPLPFESQDEQLRIRAAPRPVTRINRKVLLVGAGVGVVGLFAALSVSLRPPALVEPETRRELYATANVRKPQGLADLPASYGEVGAIPARPSQFGETELDALPFGGPHFGGPHVDSAQAGYPQLGPPLPGDLGATVLQAERELGLSPEPVLRFEEGFRPDPADEARRAQRMREAALAEEAARAPVFFRLQAEEARAASTATPGATTAGQGYASELMALAGLQQAGAGSAMSGPGMTALGPSAAAGPVGDPNLQGRKRAFAGEATGADIYNPHRVEEPVSPFQVMAGTLIAASLVTGLNSDLPGTVIAQVTQSVRDTVTGRHVLIPQGSRLIGRYQSEVSFGQDRALVAWDRIIFPDGGSIMISAPGSDAQGYAGLTDRTDHHWDRVFVAAGLATVLGIGAEAGGEAEGDIERAIRRGATDTFSQAGQRVVDRSLGIQPTIRVRPGWPVRVIVTRDLILRPPTTGGLR